MLDPFSALAVAAACVQFVDFAWKTVTLKQRLFHTSSTRKGELASISEKLEKLGEQLGQPSTCSHGQRCVYKIRNDCRDIDEDLRRLLAHLKTTVTSGSRQKSSSAVAKELTELAGLRERLRELRENLILDIIVELQESQKVRAQTLNPTSRGATTNATNDAPLGLEFLQSIPRKKRWQKDLVEAIHKGKHNDLNLLHDMPFDQQPASYFLDNLFYTDMHARCAQIELASDDTFRWLFKEDQQEDIPIDFGPWLADANIKAPRTFWISAKPGSGKSTLMKFIAGNEQARQRLRNWAQGSRIIHASFYFWSGGSRLDKTREGLLRSLLLHIFDTDHTLIKRYCPRRAQIHHLFGHYHLPWTILELQETLLTVIRNENAKFFFLVDGLDECIEDHKGLAEFIDDLAQNTNVKLCLSSRAWPIFEEHYQHSPRLELHEHTSPDICLYVQSRLGRSREFAYLRKRNESLAASLPEEIAEKSQGVFLWVKFVVDAILADLEEPRPDATIRQRLEELPEGLENMFQKMIDTMKENHRQEAYQIFQLVDAAPEHRPVKLLALSFVQNKGFPMDAGGDEPEPLGVDQVEAWCRPMQLSLTNHCKGLLEIVPTLRRTRGRYARLRSNPPSRTMTSDSLQGDAIQRVKRLASSTVQYIHRTVKDFFEKRRIWQPFEHATVSGTSNPYAALSRASLVLLKTTDLEEMSKDDFLGHISDVLHYAALSEAKTGIPLVAELDELDRTAERIFHVPSLKGRLGNFTSAQKPRASPRQRMPISFQTHIESRSHWPAAQAKGNVQHSFLGIAVQFGVRLYVERKLGSGAKIKQPIEARSLLECAILEHETLSNLSHAPAVDRSQRLRIAQLLLQLGDDPNRMDAKHQTPWFGLQGEIKKSLGVGQDPNQRKNNRGFQPQLKHFVSPRPLPIDKAKAAFLLEAAELFVKHGANCWGVDIKGVTEALGRFDAERAAALQRAMKARRLSLTHILNLSGWRREQTLFKRAGGSDPAGKPDASC